MLDFQCIHVHVSRSYVHLLPCLNVKLSNCVVVPWMCVLAVMYTHVDNIYCPQTDDLVNGQIKEIITICCSTASLLI